MTQQLAKAPATGESGGRTRAEAGVRSVSVHLTSVGAWVESASGEIIDLLARLYPSSVHADSCDGPGQQVRIALNWCAPNGSSPFYLLRSEDGAAREFDSAANALAYLDCLITDSAIIRFGSRLLVHAGSVASKGKAVLIPGASGAGKSTLVAALSVSGFEYLSDELAIIDIETGKLSPFLKPVCLKPGGWQAFSTAFGPLQAVLQARRVDGSPVSYFAAPRHRDPATLTAPHYVLLPVRKPRVHAHFEPCPRSRALIELAGNSVNLPRHGSVGIEALARLVEDSECYILMYDDLGAAVDATQSLVGCPDVPSTVDLAGAAGVAVPASD